MTFQVGDRLEIQAESIAHGGHFVARHEQSVVFCRHTAPGERVIAEITRVTQSGRVLFADAVSILQPSPDRITPACEQAGSCGGCDFQHLPWSRQRELKTQVLREQLQRFGGLPTDHPALSVTVAALPGDESGLGWRTRTEYRTDRQGRIGMRRQGSHELVNTPDCKVVVPALKGDGIHNRPWASDIELRAVAPSIGPRVLLTEAEPDVEITEQVAGFDYRLSARGFWQAHRAAPAAFIETAMRLLNPQPGEHILDLYAGVGLFTLPLAAAVGSGGRVEAVEGDRTASRYLKRNLRSAAAARSFSDDVRKWLQSGTTRRCDAVLLDPPRVGAGKPVVDAIVRLQPGRVLYVACDPASLARDTKLLRAAGYELAEIAAWDAFPMTQHFECFALFSR